MSSYNEKWVRWIEASVVSYLRAGFLSNGIASKFAGIPLHMGDNNKYVEIILDGPHLQEVAKDDHRFFLSITILAEYQVTDDIYESADVIGISMGLLRSIPIYRKGDDNVLIGCLVSDAQTARDWSGHDQGVNDTQTAIHQRSIYAELMMEL